MKPLCGWPHYGPECCILDRDNCDGEHHLAEGPGRPVKQVVQRQKIDKDGTRRKLSE